MRTVVARDTTTTGGRRSPPGGGDGAGSARPGTPGSGSRQVVVVIGQSTARLSHLRAAGGGGGGSRTRVRKRSAWDVYVRSHLGCSRRPPPEVAKKRPASPVVFALRLRAGLQAIPLCDAHPNPRGKKGPVDGLLKAASANCELALGLVPPVLRGVGLGTLPQPQQSRRNRFAPTCLVCCVWTHRKYSTALPGGSRNRPPGNRSVAGRRGAGDDGRRGRSRRGGRA